MSDHIVIIGCGGTGAALAHDLTGRGVNVTIVDRGEVFSGATGRHHGLLHSGARYAPGDPDAAVECYEENQILRRIAPWAIEPNDGLYVAISDADLDFRETFAEACERCGIPTRELTAADARQLEPALTENVRCALQVPDASFDPYRLPLSFLATAMSHGAILRRFCDVVGVIDRGGRVGGVVVKDRVLGKNDEIEADLVVNAAGAWAGEVAQRAGVPLPLKPGPGVMVALRGRLTDMVINRLHPASEGDILVPQRKLTVVGTSLWLADHPDGVRTPRDHVERMIELGARLVPSVADTKIRAVWSASRPLIDDPSSHHAPQQISRTFRCFDHGELDGHPGLLSLIGGKATTLRAMAEIAADQVCRLLGRDELASRTREEGLRPHRDFFRDGLG